LKAQDLKAAGRHQGIFQRTKS